MTGQRPAAIAPDRHPGWLAHRRPLALFAAALLGRPVSVALPGEACPPDQSPWLVLPEALCRQAPPQALPAARLALLRQLMAHGPGGRLDPARPVHPPAPGAHRSARLAWRLFQRLDAARVDARLMRWYPGLRAAIAVERQASLARSAGPSSAGWDGMARAARARWLLQSLARWAAGDAGPWAGVGAQQPEWLALQSAMARLQEPGASAVQAAAVSARLVRWLGGRVAGFRAQAGGGGVGVASASPSDGADLAPEPAAAASAAPMDDWPGGDAADDLAAFLGELSQAELDALMQTLSAGGGGVPEAESPALPAAAGRMEGGGVLADAQGLQFGDPVDGDEPTAPDGADGEPGEVQAMAAMAPVGPSPLGSAGHRPPGTPHHEWDFRQQRYRRDWVWVQEQRPPREATGYLAELLQREAALARRIQRELQALPPVRRARQRRQQDGEALDLDAAIDAQLTRRAGEPHDDAVYLGCHAPQRQWCVAWLIDISASTGFVVEPPPGADEAEPAPPPDDDDPLWFVDIAWREVSAETGVRVIDLARDAVALCGQALHRLGDRFGVFAFSGQGRLAVEFHTAKGFDDDWTAASAAAMAGLQPRGSTRSGAAIRHATALLRRRPEPHKSLVLLTDGYPQDSDYGDSPGDTDYGLQDTGHALREAEAAGIAPVCVSIDAAAHDYLRAICPPEQYLVIDDVHQLAPQLAALCARLRRGGGGLRRR